MNQVIKIYFRYRSRYYASYVTIFHEFESDFINIEFLDEDMIEILNDNNFSYTGQKGYRKLPIYQTVCLRPILNRVGNIIENALQISNNDDLKNTSYEEYIRKN